ncbi:hypothetical protein ACWA2C_16225 [Priestia megaterium]
MSKEGIINKFIQDAVSESGLPEDKIEEITSYMVTYINLGSQYGSSPEGFLRWYTEQGGSI